MTDRTRIKYTAEQKSEIWDRGKCIYRGILKLHS